MAGQSYNDALAGRGSENMDHMDIQDEHVSNTNGRAHTHPHIDNGEVGTQSERMDTGDEVMDTHEGFSDTESEASKQSAQTRNPIQTETAQVEAMSAIVAQLNTSLKATHENIKMVFRPMSETENLVDAWINTLEKAHTFSTLMLHPDYRPNSVNPTPFVAGTNSNSSGDRSRSQLSSSQIPQLPR
ncbi:hypothetical protein, variant [Sphaeroforma arctica JP610]|uniref:Uncharacterized protein n=1 Tax=Sphaeroforma arctica JP610 TaxID=667725 RepID=A0A0L0GAD8_9EUKA|nr:hypothetical protein, variant [Sphaeroforma arctica JP610]KNC85213.1 hypothetical protein, variant [Sphaeroforma arctica JP610]|eukprot:XP_014159115.1 hypothetical protein, variant [Sphaeroforma arctica JP610]